MSTHVYNLRASMAETNSLPIRANTFRVVISQLLTLLIAFPNLGHASALNKPPTDAFHTIRAAALPVNGVYRIGNRNSGKVLDLASGSADNGVAIVQWQSQNSVNQEWTLETIGDGYYKVLSKLTGKALEVGGGTATLDNGALIRQWEYVGSANQQWQIGVAADGYYTLTARHSGKCLDVKNGSTDNGTRLHQWQCYSGLSSQQWKLDLLSDPAAPTAPVGLTATEQTDASIKLVWNRSSDDVAVIGYQVYQSGSLVTTVSDTAFTVTGLAPNSTYTFTIKATDGDGKVSGASNALKAVTLSPCVAASNGSVLREVWNNVSGSTLASMPFNILPDATGSLTIFEGPTDAGDNYASRIRGYVCAPATGNYVFWIASDDQSELWLSSNAEPANKMRIAMVTDYTSVRQWNRTASQQSIPIRLAAGNRYYIEAIHREGGFGDHLAVGWQLPDATQERPIPGSSLSPFILTYPSKPTLSFSGKTTNSVVLHWSASADDQAVTGYDVFRNDTLITTVNDTTLAVSGLQPGTRYAFKVIAKDADGNTSAPAIAQVTTIPTVEPDAKMEAESLIGATSEFPKIFNNSGASGGKVVGNNFTTTSISITGWYGFGDGRYVFSIRYSSDVDKVKTIRLNGNFHSKITLPKTNGFGTVQQLIQLKVDDSNTITLLTDSGDDQAGNYDYFRLDKAANVIPSNPVVDDANNTVGWIDAQNYAGIGFYEYSTDQGTTWLPATAKPQPIGNETYSYGTVRIRVKADMAAGVPAWPALLVPPFTYTDTIPPVLAGTTLWQLGINNNSSNEFSDYAQASPERVTIPADWNSRTGWNFTSKGLKGDKNDTMRISYQLAAIPAYGVELNFRILDATQSIPQMAVFANGSMAGLIQIAGVNGNGLTYKFKEIYRLYIPKEMLQVGNNELTLVASRSIYADTQENQFNFWEWDYLKMEALAEKAREPIHGRYVHLGASSIPAGQIGQGLLTAQQCYEFTQVAYQAARDIDPNIKIESPPSNSPEADVLRGMIQLGIGNYCDYIGTHVYGAQIVDGRLDKPWQWLDQYGTTRKPIVASECGVNPNWDPPQIGGQEWRRRWQPQWYLALKRFGYSSGMLFSLTPDENPWQYYNAQFQTVYQPLADEIRKFNNSTLANGGFESANDKERQWIVYYNPDLMPPTNSTFVTGDAGGAHTGSGYLKMDVGATAAGTSISVRRIAGQLQPGVAYTIGGWVYVKGGSAGRLAVSGYNNLRGNEEKAAVSTTQNGWQYLSVTFTPANYWAVINLSTSGTGTSGDFVKWDDISTSSSVPVFNGYYKLTARHNGKALDVSGVSTANGAAVHQWDYVGGANQQWLIKSTGDGYHNLIARHSGKALDINGGPTATANGVAVLQWEISGTGGTNQQWKIEAIGEGYYKLTARHSGKCLDVESGSTANGAKTHQWNCYTNVLSQQWKIEFVQAAARLAGAEPSDEEVNLQVYPNPASSQVTIRYFATEAQQATISLTDLLSRPVQSWITPLSAGNNSIIINTEHLPRGMYMVTLSAGGKQETRKLLTN